ncbi:unnamed protein product [Adineta steineri]|uniref:Uncharacterized protein n=1 Tax=Adineta steineri TaxID=433720 RepID=A0A814UVM0_9BILA|nr:unnamed protein product [Adineta steineri]CAF1194490.1 unnamed protein product [Adineta steineri]CAF1378657.1 unnamed protein product [Adineta steineri]CAF3729030.1 unnamed protein product [Adineta steineri]CAF3779601.1 unnamed protein product [Adineta steineri]
MRYTCPGFPLCLKSFENGYVLRGHQLSCEYALVKINSNNQRQEHARTIRFNYPVNGRKGEKRYVTYTGLDNTQKFLIRDRDQFNGNNKTQQSYRRMRQPPDLKNVTLQTKSTALDFSGYYT